MLLFDFKLRPHGPALKGMMEMGAPVDDILDAAKEAGRQLVEDARMSPEILKGVSCGLLPLEMYIEIVNKRFQEEWKNLRRNSV